MGWERKGKREPEDEAKRRPVRYKRFCLGLQRAEGESGRRPSSRGWSVRLREREGAQGSYGNGQRR